MSVADLADIAPKVPLTPNLDALLMGIPQTSTTVASKINHWPLTLPTNSTRFILVPLGILKRHFAKIKQKTKKEKKILRHQLGLFRSNFFIFIKIIWLNYYTIFFLNHPSQFEEIHKKSINRKKTN